MFNQLLIVILSLCTALHAAPKKKRGPQDTLMSKLEKDRRLTRFVEYLKQGEFQELLNGNVYLTIFAPVNSAFESLASDRQQPDKIQRLMKEHMLPRKYSKAQLMRAMERTKTKSGIATLIDASRLTFTESSGRITVHGPRNSVMILEGDIVTKNGVIHIVDGVLRVP